MIVIAGTI